MSILKDNLLKLFLDLVKYFQKLCGVDRFVALRNEILLDNCFHSVDDKLLYSMVLVGY